MDNMLYELFDKLSEDLTRVENKYNVGEDSADAIPEHEIVAGIDYDEKVKKNGQTGDESGKIANLNDRFRQNQSAKDDEIKGEWVLGDDINALAPPTKAAIKKKIAEYSDFAGVPLHDLGGFDYKSKNKTYLVRWKIKVFEDDLMTTPAPHPYDPARSYRVMLVTLSDDHQEATS